MANDWCTEDGAKRLKAKIEDYWTQRGYEVNVDLVDAGFVAAMRSARTDVRSNMTNGLPRRKTRAEARSGRSSYSPRAEISEAA